MKDMLGNEIKVGNMVAWPMRAGSSTYMSIGRVTDIENEQPPKYPGARPEPARLKLLVQKRARWGLHNHAELTPTRVERVDRVLVIPHSQFGQEHRNLFQLYTNPMVETLRINS